MGWKPVALLSILPSATWPLMTNNKPSLVFTKLRPSGSACPYGQVVYDDKDNSEYVFSKMKILLEGV